MKAAGLRPVVLLVKRDLVRCQQQNLRGSARGEHRPLQPAEVTVAREPSVPGRLQPGRLGDIARVRSVIDIESREFVEADDAVQAAPGKFGGQLSQPGPVPGDVAETAAAEHFDLEMGGLLPFPGPGEESHRVAAGRTDLGHLAAVTLQAAVGKVIEQQETKFHAGGWRSSGRGSHCTRRG